MKYVTITIRIPEKDYLRLKQEAAEKGKSLSAVIRSKLGIATKTDWKGLHKALKQAKGILKEYSPEEIAPARGKSAWKSFGEWDKEGK